MRGSRSYPDSQRYPQYYGNDPSRPRAVSPTRSGRYARNSDMNYYDHRGHSRPVREDYHGNGYRGRSSRRYGMDKPRMYMAVYDYDPYTMSPNPSLANEELSFHEGQIIKVNCYGLLFNIFKYLLLQVDLMYIKYAHVYQHVIAHITNSHCKFMQVYSEKDSDGYFTGEINGRIGLVPYKMVTEIPEEEEEAARHLMNENMSTRHHHSGIIYFLNMYKIYL